MRLDKHVRGKSDTDFLVRVVNQNKDALEYVLKKHRNYIVKQLNIPTLLTKKLSINHHQ